MERDLDKSNEARTFSSYASDLVFLNVTDRGGYKLLVKIIILMVLWKGC